MDAYALVLSEAAAMSLVAASRAEQRRLARAIDGLKMTPFRRADFRERDSNGRANEVILADDWLLTFWPDHAAREIRVVRIDRVQD